MSEVRPGGDSSDSLAEMTKPKNLQTPDSSAENIQQSHGDKHFVKPIAESVRLLSNSEQDVKSQQQYATYNPEKATDSEAVQSSTDPNAGFTAKVHIRQLFVGNLPFRVRWQDLKDMFKKAGEVVRADVAIGFDNRSKGHGTVLFATVEDARQAVEMFHNYAWQGRILEVREDRGYIDNEIHSCNYGHTIHHYGNNTTKTTQPNTAPVNTQYYNHMYANQNRLPLSNPSNGRQLFVGNIPFNCQWQDLKDLFRNAGNILRADIAQGQDGRSRGFGTVLYATPEDARNAVAIYDGYEYQGRRLRVYFDKFASTTSNLLQVQAVPKLRTRLQDQIRLQSPPFPSSMPYSQMPVTTATGMQMYQSPPLPINGRQYFPAYTAASDMIIPTHMAFANSTMNESQGMMDSPLYTMNSMEQPEHFASMLNDQPNHFLPVATGFAGEHSGLGSLDTEASGLPPYHGAAHLHMDSVTWNGDHQHSFMYRQHPHRTQQTDYSWLQPPMSHTFQSERFLPTSHTEYMSNQPELYVKSTHDVETINALTGSMSALRFEGTAGLPQNDVYDTTTENTGAKIAASGRGGIARSDAVWDRQEAHWDTPLTDSYKL